MLTSESGSPLAPQYAEALAAALGWRQVVVGQTAAWHPPGRAPGAKPNGAYYHPLLTHHDVNVKVFLPQTCIHLFLMDEPTSGEERVSVTIIGEDPEPETWDTILAAITPLPYGTAVAERLIAKADWLDANPMFRGLPKIADRHLKQDALEAPERPLDWDW